MPVKQIIEDRYLDPNKLEALLARKHREGEYTVTVGLDHPLPGGQSC